jgi:hypothetical protein
MDAQRPDRRWTGRRRPALTRPPADRAAAGSPETGEGRRALIIIVARDQQTLFEYLKGGLARLPQIRVILDRRRGSRRAVAWGQVAVAPAVERRQGERRRWPGTRAELMARGFMIVG